jgi:hypothetical protein
MTSTPPGASISGNPTILLTLYLTFGKGFLGKNANDRDSQVALAPWAALQHRIDLRTYWEPRLIPSLLLGLVFSQGHFANYATALIN